MLNLEEIHQNQLMRISRSFEALTKAGKHIKFATNLLVTSCNVVA